MARINLLPWREELRKQKTTEFATIAGIIGICAAILVGLASMQVGAMNNYQKSRNQFIQQQIDILNTQLEQIKDLESTKENLLARMNIIQELQRSRPQIVHLFEELVLTVPEGVWLSSIKQNNANIRLIGKAESNARVSAYMRNLDSSDWLKNPVLDVIEAEKDDRIASFTLDLAQESPNSTDEEEGEE